MRGTDFWFIQQIHRLAPYHIPKDSDIVGSGKGHGHASALVLQTLVQGHNCAARALNFRVISTTLTEFVINQCLMRELERKCGGVRGGRRRAR